MDNTKMIFKLIFKKLLGTSTMDTIAKDSLIELFLNTPLPDCANLCKSNKQLADLCKDENLWRQKFLQDFTAPPTEPVSWKQLYQQLYLIAHPNTISLLYCKDADGTHMLLSAPTQKRLMETIVTIYNYNLMEHERLLIELNILIYEFNSVYDLNILERFFSLEQKSAQLLPAVEQLLPLYFGDASEEAESFAKYFTSYYFNPFLLTHLFLHPDKLKQILAFFDFLYAKGVGTDIIKKVPTVDDLLAISALRLDPNIYEGCEFAHRSNNPDFTRFATLFNDLFVTPLILNPPFTPVAPAARQEEDFYFTRFIPTIGDRLLEFMIWQSYQVGSVQLEIGECSLVC